MHSGNWRQISVGLVCALLSLSSSLVVRRVGAQCRRIGSAELATSRSFLTQRAYLGGDVQSMGDLDGDGLPEVLVGISRLSVPARENGGVLVGYSAPDGGFRRYRRIDALNGGTAGAVCDSCRFGHGVDSLGDVDGDGNPDIVVGSQHESLDGPWRGAARILFLGSDLEVRRYTRIVPSQVEDYDIFGHSVAALGDLDGNGVVDLAVGALGDDGPDDGSANSSGAVWILFLNRDGSNSHAVRINANEGFASAAPRLPVTRGNLFGEGVAALGDLNGDGIVDLAVTSVRDAGGGVPDQPGPGGIVSRRGALYLLLLNRNGEYEDFVKITDDGQSGFEGSLPDSTHFGREVEVLAPAVEGRARLVVGQSEPTDRGSFWLLDIDWSQRPEVVVAQRKIGRGEGGLREALEPGDQFSFGIAAVGDLDGNGVEDLYVGAQALSEGGERHGALWRILLDPDLTVRNERKISSLTGDFDDAPLSDGDRFGAGIAWGSEIDELLVGAAGHDGVHVDQGCVYRLSSSSPAGPQRIVAPVGVGAEFGTALLLLDGVNFGSDLQCLVGAPGDATIWSLAVGSAPESVARRVMLTGSPSWTAASAFGTALALVGQRWIAVGAPGDHLVALYPLRPDGFSEPPVLLRGTDSVFGYREEPETFGSALTGVPDLDGDGRAELAIGVPGLEGRGDVWLTFLDETGGIRSAARIDLGASNLNRQKSIRRFGQALAVLGNDLLVGFERGVLRLDVDKYGRLDFAEALDIGPSRGATVSPWAIAVGGTDGLAVGDPFDGRDGRDRGAVWTCALSPTTPPSPTKMQWMASPAPNPFHDSMSVRIRQQVGGSLLLAVYDIAGRRVRILHDSHLSAGDYTFRWDGRDGDGHRVAAGVYQIRGRAPGRGTAVRRIVWLP